MSRARSRAGLIAAALLVVALGLRLAEVQRTSYRPINDAGFYLRLGAEIARTGDYSTSTRPGAGAGGTRGPSAYFAPGYPYLIAAVDVVDGHVSARDGAIAGARLSQVLLGVVAVALIGLVALELFGPQIALIALAIAAVYPVTIGLTGTLVAENLLTPLVLGAVYCALRARRALRHPRAWALAAGILIGLATLTHENAILIAVPLIFAVWQGRPRFAPGALVAPGLLIGATCLTIAPWTVRNAVELHGFIPVSDETGITLVGTYNAASAADARVPYKWRLFLAIPGERTHGGGRLTEPQLSSALEHQALSYIGSHPLAPVEAGWHNTLRLLELEGSFAWRASASSVGLPIGVARIGVLSFWLLCLLAVGGAFTRAVRAGPRWLWTVPLLLVLGVVFVNAETPRFREPVDPFLILIAACALASVAERLRARAGRGPQRGLAAEPVAAEHGAAVSP